MGKKRWDIWNKTKQVLINAGKAPKAVQRIVAQTADQYEEADKVKWKICFLEEEKFYFIF